MKLLVVGSMAFDAIETPFGKTDKILGGAATYIGLAASIMKTDVSLVSVVGGDFPQEYLDMLTSRNINIDGVEVIKEGKSFFWSGKYHNDLNTRDTLVTEVNVLADFDPKVPESAQEADVLLLGNLDPAIQLSVLDKMKTRPKLVILDTMNFWMDIAWDNLMKMIAKTDVITINDEEVPLRMKQEVVEYFDENESGNAYLLFVDLPKKKNNWSYYIFRIQMTDLENGDKGEAVYFLEKKDYIE